MNRVEAMQKIAPTIDGEIRHVRDANGTRVIVTPDMVTLRPRKGAQVVEMDPVGTKAMVNLAGLPIGIAKALSPNTFGTVLSELLGRVGSYSLVLNEDKVTDIVAFGEKPTVNPERLLNLIEKTIPVTDYGRVDILPQRVVSIEIAGQKEAPVARGELVRAGVKVNFSPMGTVSPTVQSFAVVLACTNGQTSNRVLREYGAGGGGGGGEGDNLWQFFRESVKGAYNSFEKVVEGYKKLRTENITPQDRARMLDALLKQAGIGGKIAESVRSMAIERPPANAWEMQNLITYASSHLLEGPSAQRAQRAAADFADESTHAQSCPLCRRTR